MVHTPQQSVEEVRSSLGVPELEQLIHAVDPTVLLISSRILRRVIKQDANIVGFGLRVPHRKTYLIAREALLAIVDPFELDLPTQTTLPATLILLARPTPQSIATQSREGILLKYWRLLFHVRVHLAFDYLLQTSKFNAELAAQRIAELGEPEFAEAGAILRQEDMLLPPKSDLNSYVEFAAVYLELRHFAPELLTSYFPTLRELDRVDDLIGQDLDVEGLFAATRLSGAPDPLRHHDSEDQPAPQMPRLPSRPEHLVRRTIQYRHLTKKANRAQDRGNVVRAAILHTRAAQVVSGNELEAARLSAHENLEQLAKRLQSACEFSLAEIEQWSKALMPLLENSARGAWTPEARLLYDLQKVCVDNERGIYALNLWPWLRSIGHEPLKRLLPGQRDVLMVKHLRGAKARLSAVRISARTRRRLEPLLETVVYRTEELLRLRFRPLIDETLNQVDLVPRNLPERVGRKKLVDELLDRIVERGFLSMGDLRDALSRNNLKLPDIDLSQLDQWFAGNQLLQADRRLGVALDGVYRRGEIYLRLPQRLSSMAFGTPWGRFLTQYVAIPFGGAYLLLEGIYHLVQFVLWLLGRGAIHAATSEAQRTASLEWWLTVFGVGVVIEGLVHHPGFRRFCLKVGWWGGQICRRAFIDLPAQFFNLPVVQALIRSPYFRLLQRYLLKPALVSILVMTGISLLGNRRTTFETGAGIFIAVNVLLNSRFGRSIDEIVTDWTVQSWHRFRIHVITALFRFIIELFQRILETVERLLYTVDEWLRFKAGEGYATTTLKVVLTPVWRLIDYVIRIFVNLLIEPQINPIKHFPVVTVSHKIILPFLPHLTQLLARPLGRVWAGAIAPPAIFLLPGVFGFLVWELKENWRLYAANRPQNLGPIIVGHHGETVIRFMRPGFRSGTLPKIYAKLRKANRKAFWTGRWKSAAKQLANLHGVEEQLRRFVERELLTLIVDSPLWHAGPLTTGEVRLGTTRILIELYASELEDQSLWLALEQRGGWLVASVYRHGWLDRLDPQQKLIVANALAGFYKLAGVDVVREQVDVQIHPASQRYDLDERGLIIKSFSVTTEEIVYPLRDWPPNQVAQPLSSISTYVPDRQKVVFAAQPISWQRWVLAWDEDDAGKGEAHLVLIEPHILPNEIVST